MPRRNDRARREERRVDADRRYAERTMYTNSEQINRLNDRPGRAAKEIARLLTQEVHNP